MKAANGVAKELRTLPNNAFENDWFEEEFEEQVIFFFLENCDNIGKEWLFDEQELLSEVNYTLGVIYDICNVLGVWLGLKGE